MNAPINSTQRPQSRMTLTGGSKGKQDRPERILLYGVEGVGKSTFAASAPGAIFLDVEAGTKHLDIQRTQQPETWQDVLDGVRMFEGQHEFKTLVIDTADRCESMLWSHICSRDGKASIEEYGYGKGYQAALDEWRVLLAALDRLVGKRGMNVILLAHSWIRTFKNPTGEDFDRYQLKIHDKASGLIREWCDHVLFAAFEEFAHKKDAKSKTEKAKGISTNARLIYTTKHAAYDAKHRGELPEQMPLDWPTFIAALRANRAAPIEEILSEIRDAISTWDDAMKAKTEEAIARASGDATKLAQLMNWTRGKGPVISTTTTAAP